MTETSQTPPTVTDLDVVKTEIFQSIDVELKRKILMAYGISRDRAEHATYEKDGFWTCIESTGPLSKQIVRWADLAPNAHDKLANYFGLRTLAEQAIAAARLSAEPTLLKKKVSLLQRLEKRFDEILSHADGGATNFDRIEARESIQKMMDNARTTAELETVEKQVEPLLTLAVKASADAKSARSRAAAAAAIVATSGNDVELAGGNTISNSSSVVAIEEARALAAAMNDGCQPPKYAVSVSRKYDLQRGYFVPANEIQRDFIAQSSAPPFNHNTYQRSAEQERQEEYWRNGLGYPDEDAAFNAGLSSSSSYARGSGFGSSFVEETSFIAPSRSLHEHAQPLEQPTFIEHFKTCCTQHPPIKDGYRRTEGADGTIYQLEELPRNAKIVTSARSGDTRSSNDNRHHVGPQTFSSVMAAQDWKFELKCEICHKVLYSQDAICLKILEEADVFVCTECRRVQHSHVCSPPCQLSCQPPWKTAKYFLHCRDMHYIFVRNDHARISLFLEITETLDPGERKGDTAQYACRIEPSKVGVFQVKNDTLIAFRHDGHSTVWGARRSNGLGGWYSVREQSMFSGDVHFIPFSSLCGRDWLVAWQHFLAYRPEKNITYKHSQPSRPNSSPLATNSDYPSRFVVSRPLNRPVTAAEGFQLVSRPTASSSAATNADNDDNIIDKLKTDQRYLEQESKFLSECAANKERGALAPISRPPPMRQVARTTFRAFDQMNDNNYSEFLVDPISTDYLQACRERALTGNPFLPVQNNNRVVAATTKAAVPKTPAPTTEDLDRDVECTICLDAAAIMKNSNCSHTIMCSVCAVTYIEKSAESRKDATCPICRAPIVDLLLDAKSITTRSTKRAKAKE